MRLLFLLILLCPLTSFAWSPVGNITIVLPFQQSGASGQVAYLLKSELFKRGVSANVLHKPGLLGAIGHKYLAESPADGMTIGIVTTAGLDAGDAVNIISTFGNQSFMLVSSGGYASSINSLLNDVASTERKFGLVNAGHELGLKAVLSASGISDKNVIRIPYKSGTQLYVDLAAGDIHFSFGATPGVIAFANTGRVKMLGVSTPTRITAFPNVPAIKEVLPKFVYDSYMMVAVPLDTPADAIKFYSKMFSEILSSRDVSSFLYGHPIHMTKR